MSQRKAPPKIGAPAADLLPAVIESLLFVAEEPQEISTLAKATDTTRKQVERALDELADGAVGRGLFVQRLGDRVQLATVPDAAPYVERFLEVEHGRLSRASLETLAIIAYRQPVTRAEIEAVRGVDPDHAVQMLMARELIEEVGRAPGPGRPVLFATTVRFLEYFGLRRPDDLPPLPELEGVPDEARQQMLSPAEAPSLEATASGGGDEEVGDGPSSEATASGGGDEEVGDGPSSEATASGGGDEQIGEDAEAPQATSEATASGGGDGQTSEQPATEADALEAGIEASSDNARGELGPSPQPQAVASNDRLPPQP